MPWHALTFRGEKKFLAELQGTDALKALTARFDRADLQTLEISGLILED